MRKLGISLAIGIGIATLLGGFFYEGFFEEWHYKLVKSLYQKQKTASNDVVIIAIDAASTRPEALGKFKFWHRDYYSKVVNYLTEAEAKVIGIDLLFSEPSRGFFEDTFKAKKDFSVEDLQEYFGAEIHPYDKRFGEALEKAGMVVLAKQAFSSKDDREVVENVQRSFGPLAIFEKFVKTGWINVGEKNDARVFRVPIGYKVGNNFEESFDMAVARTFYEISEEPTLNSIKDRFYEFYKKPQIVIQVAGEVLKDKGYEADIKIPIFEDGMMINYYADSTDLRTFPVFSFKDVYSGKIAPENFKNKIVLIGYFDPSFGDYHYTPIDEGAMAGILIHANAIQTVLDRNFLRVAGSGFTIGVLVVISVITAMAFSYLNLWLSLILLPLTWGGYFVTGRWQFENGVILNMVYPFLAMGASFVVVYLYKYLTEYKDKRRLKEAFSHYVNPTLVREIMRHPEMLKLGGERRMVSVFFSDVKGFTSISEKLTPEQLVSLLNEYLEEMTDIILEYGGTVDKYEGDAIMAFWNAPIAQNDHALKACECAISCRRRVKELQSVWQKVGKPLLDFRVGINSGEVIVGNMGSKKRFEYTVIGDTVNLAARLESANKFYGTNLMIGEETAKLVEAFFVMRPMDLIRVKGKEKPVYTYEIVCMKEDLLPEMAMFLQEFGQGFSNYLKGIFSEAHKIFFDLNKRFPQDALTKVYLLRCGEFLKSRPANWDGVWTFSEK